MANRIKIRRDTASNWTSVNPVLSEGELGIEIDTLKVKIGSASLNWSSLPYISQTWTVATASIATSASYALSASFAPTILPNGIVSSSAQAASWTVATASIATSASYALSASFAPTILPDGIVSSSAQAASWTVATASIATSASYATNWQGGLIITPLTTSDAGIQTTTTGSTNWSHVELLWYTGSDPSANRRAYIGFGPTLAFANNAYLLNHIDWHRNNTASSSQAMLFQAVRNSIEFRTVESGSNPITWTTILFLSQSSSRLSGSLTVSGNILPQGDNAYSLGTNSSRFSEGNIVNITSSNAQVNNNLIFGGGTTAYSVGVATRMGGRDQYEFYNSSYTNPLLIISNSAGSGIVSASEFTGIATYNKNAWWAPISGTFGRTSWFVPNQITAGTTNATMSLGNTIHLSPFIAPNANTASIREIGINVTFNGGANQSCSISLYTNRAGLLYPETLITSSMLRLGSNTVFSASINSTSLISGEIYWIGIHSPSSNLVFRSISAQSGFSMGSNALGASLINQYTSGSNWGSAGSYVPAWPSPITTNLTQTEGTPPLIGLRYGL